MNNKNLIETLKLSMNPRYSWSGEKQKNALIETISPHLEQMKNFSFDEKKEVLNYAIRLSRKSYINILAKHFDINLNDEKIKMWTELEYCRDNQYALDIIDKKENWLDYANDTYFFECVLMKGGGVFISPKEKEFNNKFTNLLSKKTDLHFWLSKEKITGLSKISYVATKHSNSSIMVFNIFDIKPNWLEKDFSHQFQVDENNIQWDRIIKGNENYSENAIKVVRKMLENFWLQKTENGKFVFEHEKIAPYLLPEMWLFNEKHFELNLFNSEEKAKLLEKLLNYKNPSTIEMNQLTTIVIKASLNDSNMKWHQINFEENALEKLSEMDNETYELIKVLIVKNQLEESISNKNTLSKKMKI
jgi:hypothetical protein